VGALFLVPLGAESARGAFPIFFLFLQPLSDANLLNAVKVIQNNLVVLPFFMAEGDNPLAGIFRAKGAGLGAVVFVADYEFAFLLVGSVATGTGLLAFRGFHLEGRLFTCLFLADNHAAASAAIESAISCVLWH
jgi:hypothetical protein